jgi:O-antigen/teichoic acid export membrane protein
MRIVRSQLGSGLWISVSQVAQVLLNGSDLFVIGKLLGPAAVVPYACTAKLVTLLANQPQLFMQMALPALSELRTGAARARLFQISRGMAQVMLLGSGAIACIVWAVNAPFVTWWVGGLQYAGRALTLMLVISMLLRHWNITAVWTLFCFGHERRLAVTNVADGLVSVVAMLLLVPWLGIHGAVLGSLLGTCVVSLPNNLRTLAREEGVSLLAAIEPLRPWFARFAAVSGATSVLLMIHVSAEFWKLALVSALIAGFYAAVMLPVLLTPPLGPILVSRFQPWVSLAPGLARRAAKAATTS